MNNISHANDLGSLVESFGNKFRRGLFATMALLALAPAVSAQSMPKHGPMDSNYVGIGYGSSVGLSAMNMQSNGHHSTMTEVLIGPDFDAHFHYTNQSKKHGLASRLDVHGRLATSILDEMDLEYQFAPTFSIGLAGRVSTYFGAGYGVNQSENGFTGVNVTQVKVDDVAFKAVTRIYPDIVTVDPSLTINSVRLFGELAFGDEDHYVLGIQLKH